MSRKRNDFLEGSDEEDSLVHDSDVEADTRFGAFPSAKRQKLDSINSGEDSAASENEQEGAEAHREGSLSDQSQEELDDPAETGGKSRKKVKPVTSAQLAASQLKARKTGVLYVSRIPPFMKPAVLRQFLSPYGTILRLFLTPEASPAYKKRVKSGGNKKRSFIDGWVEFESKKKARICAESINGQNIGGKKGGFYYDDIWNVKYLKGFKWADLMEQVQGEERLREGRMRAELMKEQRERKAFLGNMEASKRKEGMEAKRKKKREKDGGVEDDGRAAAMAADNVSAKTGDKQVEKPGRAEFRFRQNEVKSKTSEKAGMRGPDEVKRVLGKIF